MMPVVLCIDHRVLDGADACLNATVYYTNLLVMETCLKAKVPYTDMGGLFHITRKQLELHDEYKGVVAKLVHKWRRLGFLPEKDRQRLMISLNMMRMVCDSSYILDQESRHD